MPAQIRVKVTGVDKAVSDFHAIADRAVDPRPAFQEVGRDFLRVAASQFDRGGGTKPWAQLAASTVATKRRDNLDPRILVATGRLKDSLARAGGEHVERMTHALIEMGSSVPYFQAHQTGTWNGKRMTRLPKRPLVIPKRSQSEWRRFVREYVVHGER
jgi:phage gpG-like protein